MNSLLSKLLIFLIIAFKILGHVEKRNFYQRTPFSKASFFWYFQTATCYNSSLVLSKLDPAFVKAAYNIAVLNLTETLWFPLMDAVLLMLKRVWTRLPRFSADAKVTHAQDISSVIETNKLKSKVLKNNTTNGKNLRIIKWMVKEGQKGASTYRVPGTACNEKRFPLIKKEFTNLIFHILA